MSSAVEPIEPNRTNRTEPNEIHKDYVISVFSKTRKSEHELYWRNLSLEKLVIGFQSEFYQKIKSSEDQIFLREFDLVQLPSSIELSPWI